jgi:pimeloyl-ACP methyl ester carboxylesterase
VEAELRRRSVLCASPKGLHRMAYVEWGDPRNRDVLVCVAGLTRTGRDFDELAQALCGRYRVVCPDLAGRGDSDKLADPMLYNVPQYVADMVTLIARLDCEALDWVGTSLGGLVGMALAAQPGNPLKKLVLNDAGPVISRVSLQRIGTTLGVAPQLPTVEKAEEYVRTISAPFGAHSDAEWRTITERWARQAADGSWRPNYDPRIALAYRASLPEQGDVELWPLYDAIRCPTLVLRGEQSDLLSRATTEAMAQRGPKAKVVEFPGVGHAPTLMHADQIAVVRDFLLQGQGS